jgi:general secretion pathway protein L
VVVNGACEAARTFPGGWRELADALARELGVAPADAESWLAALGRGEPPPPELGADGRAGAALQRAMVTTVRELRATLRAWRARLAPEPRSVARLRLAGDVARLPGLAELFAPEVEGEVAPLTLGPAAAGPLDEGRAPAYALAAALALRGHQGGRGPRLNLRRGELAFTRDFQHVKGKVVRLAVYASLVLLLALAGAGAKVFALRRQEKLLDRALCDTTQQVLGRCYDNFETAEAVLRGKGTPAAAVPRVSAVEVFAELAGRTPQDLPLRFDRIEITRDKLHLQGTTDTAEGVDKIVTALRASRCFGDAHSGGARRRPGDGKFEFTIDSTLTCDTQPAGGRT